MAEDEINYASVVFKSNKQQGSAVKKEETVYDKVKVQNNTTEQTAGTNVKKEETVYGNVKMQNNTKEQTAGTNASAEFLSAQKSNRRCCHYQQLACGLGTLCIMLLLGIIAVSVILVKIHENDETELNNLKENQATLNAVNRNLTNLNNKLSSDNEDLKQNQTKLTLQRNNLTQALTLSENKVTNLTNLNNKLSSDNEDLKQNQSKLTLQRNNLTQALTLSENEAANLTEENQKLSDKNEKLETEKKNLKEQIRDMVTSWNELNVSRAQWSIDAYCPKDKNRKCDVCQPGWLASQSNCYAINNANPSEQKNWTDARADCRGKISDLAVVINDGEKKYVSDNSWGSKGTNGYWIGLRVEGGNWKWVDGRNLTNTSWITQPAIDGQCAISVYNEGFKSVSCNDTKEWICKKKALTL